MKLAPVAYHQDNGTVVIDVMATSVGEYPTELIELRITPENVAPALLAAVLTAIKLSGDADALDAARRMCRAMLGPGSVR